MWAREEERWEREEWAAGRRTHVVGHSEEHRRREDDALSVDAGIDEFRCAPNFAGCDFDFLVLCIFST